MGKHLNGKNILAGVPQGSTLGPLLFLIYKNDLPQGVTSLCKTFADDTYLFFQAINRTHSEMELNKDLKLNSQWVYMWKILLTDYRSVLFT